MIWIGSVRVSVLRCNWRRKQVAVYECVDKDRVVVERERELQHGRVTVRLGDDLKSHGHVRFVNGGGSHA